MALLALLLFPQSARLSAYFQEALLLAAKKQHLPPPALLSFSPLETLLTQLHLSFYLAFILSLPLLFLYLGQFLFPALSQKEQRLTCGLLFSLSCALLLALLFVGALLLPSALAFLLFYDTQNAVMSFWNFASLVQFTLYLFALALVSIGALLLGIVLVLFGYLPPELFFSSRRFFILLALIVGALVTPPDVLSQLAFALPMIAGFELLALLSLLRRFFCKER